MTRGKAAEMRTVLIIDDEDDIRAVARLSLERVGGWGVRDAASAGEGIELAARESPDAILLDMMMPDIDGAQAIGRLKADARTAEIPVIFLTAKLQGQDVERYTGLGAVGVVAKPFDPMGLPGEIGEILGWE